MGRLACGDYELDHGGIAVLGGEGSWWHAGPGGWYFAFTGKPSGRGTAEVSDAEGNVLASSRAATPAGAGRIFARFAEHW